MRAHRTTRGVAAVTLCCFVLGTVAPAAAQPRAEPPLPPPPEQPLYQPPPAQPGYPAYPPPVYPAPAYTPTVRTPIRYDLKPRYGLIVGGSVTLGAMWLISLAAGGISVLVNDACTAASTSTAGCPTAAWPLFVPVAGPFIQMAYLDGVGANTARVLLAFDGLVQLGGLAMIIAGSLARKRVPVYANRLQIAPLALGGGAGLLAQGRF